MEKLVYVMWGDGAPLSGDRLRDLLLGDTAAKVVAAGARALTVNVHDAAAAEAPSPAPTPEGEDPHVAELSVWVDSYDRRHQVEEVVEAVGLATAGYLVVESLYEDYGTTPHAPPRSWADGRRSPGVLTVSLIHRPAGLDYATWIERWHGTQSPLSGRLQPRCRYVRNEVLRPLTTDAPEIHGIVEEAWPSAAHVADPMLFFNAGGDPNLMTENITAMLDSVHACLDLSRLRNVTMSEYFVKSLAYKRHGACVRRLLGMAITGMHAILYTPQPDELRAVFRDVFGFANIDAHDGWLIFRLPPAEMGIHPSDGAAHELTFMCDDITATMAELSEKGVTFEGAPQAQGFGVVTTMVLPGDVKVLLYEPRHETTI